MSRVDSRGSNAKARVHSALAHRLREARLEVGMTQEELSAAIGASRSLVCLFERQHRKSMSADTLLRLADALDVRPQWLLYGHEPKRHQGRPEGQINAIVLARIETHVENVIREDRAPIKPEFRAAVVAAQYETFVRTGKTPTKLAVRRAIMAAAQGWGRGGEKQPGKKPGWRRGQTG